MKILLFGGTTEGRLLAEELLKRGQELTVSCATELGAEELKGMSCRILQGRLEEAQMENLVKDYELVVDATHPYAKLVTENIEEACKKSETSYIRISREMGKKDERGCSKVKSCQAAAEYLQGKEGNILITTGAKELSAYAGLDPQRLFARVLPTHAGIEACEKIGLAHRNILALQGPFSQEMNEAIIRQYQIRYLVTKDGGKAGGFSEKAKAAENTGIELILVERPEDKGISMQEFLERSYF